MSLNQQKTIWNRHWERQNQINPEGILNSRFTQEAYRCLKSYIKEKEDKLILEAGCGTGRLCCLLARDFPNLRVIGIDISPNSLKIANLLKEYLHVSNVSFEIGDLFQIPYPDNYFDVVFNEGVIEHYSLRNNANYIDAFKEMIRVTKKGGKIIIAVPNWYNFPHTLYKWALNKLGKKYIYGYEKSFRHSELLKLYLEFGLTEIEMSAFYPEHGFYRLSGEGFRKIFYLLGKMTNLMKSFLDAFFDGYFTKRFGFEIVIKGVKK